MQSNILQYYQHDFNSELAKFCYGRIDNSAYGPHNRVVRINMYGYEPIDKYKFLFCLYFITLTDMTLHTYYRKEHYEFDKQTNFPKITSRFFIWLSPPNCILIDKVGNDITQNIELEWKAISDFFIKTEWSINLKQMLNISIKDFMLKIVSDKDFNPEHCIYEKILKKYINDELNDKCL